EAFNGVAASAKVINPVSFEGIKAGIKLPAVVSRDAFNGVSSKTILPTPLVDNRAFEGIKAGIKLPVVINREAFNGVAASAKIINPVSFEGIKAGIKLPAVVSRDAFNGVSSKIILPTPLVDNRAFEGIRAGIKLPAVIGRDAFDGVSGKFILPKPVVPSKPLFEEAKAVSVLSKPINPLIFEQVSGEVKIKVMFPGGSKIIPTYGVGVPLGAERPLLEPSIKEKRSENN
ncbi:MAG: hypothetical protein ABIH18_06630, partial [Candidatus Omnitrophota bacterium]